MKKTTKKNPTTETTTTAPAATAEPQQQEQQKQEPDMSRRSPAEGEAKADFYARLLTERPNEAASIMATLNRRKDFALRQLSAHLKAGRDVHAALQHAMAIAFPKHKEAAP